MIAKPDREIYEPIEKLREEFKDKSLLVVDEDVPHAEGTERALLAFDAGIELDDIASEWYARGIYDGCGLKTKIIHL